jgi:uncharacterized protein (TIGR02246 family)
MANSVPDVINRYIAALNGRDPVELLALFTPDAVVVDEGETWRGTSEISTWVADIAFRFHYNAEVLRVETTETATMLLAFALRATFQAGPSNSMPALMLTKVGSVDWRTRRNRGRTRGSASYCNAGPDMQGGPG